MTEPAPALPYVDLLFRSSRSLTPADNLRWISLRIELVACAFYSGVLILNGAAHHRLGSSLLINLCAISYHLTLLSLNRLPGFRRPLPQLVRITVEALAILALLAAFQAWSESLWLLFLLPTLVVAQELSLLSVLLFSIAIVAGQALTRYLTGSGVPSDLEIYRWGVEGVTLLLFGSTLVLIGALYALPNAILTLLREGIFESFDSSSFPWNSVAKGCAESMGFEKILIFDFKALRGTALLRGDSAAHSGPRAVEDSGLGVTREFQVPPEDRLIQFLRSKNFVHFEHFAQVEESWLSALLPPGARSFASVIENSADNHILGFLIAAYRPDRLAIWGGGLAPVGKAVTDLAKDFSPRMDQLRRLDLNHCIATMAPRILRALNLEEICRIVAEALHRLYGVPTVIWRVSLDLDTSEIVPFCRSGSVPGLPNSIALRDLEASFLEGEGTTLQKTPEFSPPALAGAAAALYFPITSGEHPSLLIALYSFSMHETAIDLKNVSTSIAGSALIPTLKIALTNSGLQMQRENLERLHGLSQELMLVMDQPPESAMGLISKYVVSSLGFLSAGWFFPLHNQWQHEEIKVLGTAPSELHVNKWRLLEGLRHDIDHAHYLRVDDQSTKSNRKAALFIPASAQATLVLVSDLASIRENFDALFLGVFRDQLTLVLESCSSNTRMKAYSDGLDEVGRLGESILRSEKLSYIMEATVKAALELTEAQLAAIQFLRPSGNNELEVVECFDPNGRNDDIIGVTLVLGQGVTGSAAQLRKPLVVRDVRGYRGYVSLHKTTVSEIAVPLLDTPSGELLGVLNVESQNLGFFDSTSLEILSRLATLFVIGVNQARRIERLEDAQRRLESAENLAMIGLLYGENIHLAGNKLGAARAHARRIARMATDKDIADLAGSIARSIEVVLDLNKAVRENVRYPEARAIDLNALVSEVAMRITQGSSIAVMHDAHSLANIFGLDRQIEQIFRVVIHNAVKAMGGVGVIHITLTDFTREGVEFLRVVIEDSGPGIPPEKLPYLFQLGKPSYGRDGLGIGLPWVHFFLGMYGGSIAVESSESSGVRIVIDIPRDYRQTASDTLYRRS